MAQFRYVVNRKGKEWRGVVEASGIHGAAEKLLEQGGYILELQERFSWGSLRFSQRLNKWLASRTLRMDVTEKILFTAQLGSMLKTGLPVTKAIEAFVDEGQTRTSVLLRRVLEQLRAGKSFSEALAEFPRVFDKVYINVLKSGETMGKLAESLVYLGKQMKKEHGLRVKVKSAMTYPIVVLMAMAGVMTFIAVSVLPKIVVFAKNAGAKLPQITQIIVTMSVLMQTYWWLIILGLVTFIALGWKFTQTQEGRKFVDKLWLTMPIINNLVKRYNQARFARLLSGFYRYGISLKVAFEILADSSDNYYYAQACRRMGEKIMMGKSLSNALAAERELFSGIMVRVVKGAEQTGGLDETLSKLAQFYEEELETSLNNLTTIIEPILIIFLGIGVIGIALAVIVPIYRVTAQLR